MSMKTKYYDAIVAPIITEKATILSEHNQVVYRSLTKTFL